jgi:hypothetical protein
LANYLIVILQFSFIFQGENNSKRSHQKNTFIEVIKEGRMTKSFLGRDSPFHSQSQQ